MIINLLKFILFVAVCLLVFTLMYDHCVYGKSIIASLKERLTQLFLSPILYFLFKVSVIVAIFYLVYALIHKGSLF